jgi:hypothetical protein
MLIAGNLFEYINMLPSGRLVGSFGNGELGSEFIIVAEQ